MKIAILGFGLEGEASLKYFSKPGNEITICDRDEAKEIPDGVARKLGDDYLTGLNIFDLIVRTPAIRPDAISVANPESPEILGKVTTSINEFFKACPSKNLIAVTGTKGKGTTSTLVSKILAASGLNVHLGGNIGTAPLTMLEGSIQKSDWVILELSSFQLMDIKHSPHIGICLMVVAEHLDWHTDVSEYITAKSQLFRWQQTQDIAIYLDSNENSIKVVETSDGQKIPYMSPPGAYVKDNQIMIDGQNILDVGKLKLLGKHNWQNACAAVTACWQVSKDLTVIQSVLSSFSGLEHRIELVRDLSGVKYYDDSYGTTPETAIVAIEAIQGPIIIILGGSDKNANYDQLAKTVVSGNVKHVVVIGQTAGKIKQALSDQGFSAVSEGGDTIEQIVAEAKNHAVPGDSVILSPACASFGLFKNYKDRGEQFQKTVKSLS